jgi:hypothetical protein
MAWLPKLQGVRLAVGKAAQRIEFITSAVWLFTLYSQKIAQQKQKLMDEAKQLEALLQEGAAAR